MARFLQSEIVENAPQFDGTKLIVFVDDLLHDILTVPTYRFELVT
jgi:hypothetical protein